MQLILKNAHIIDGSGGEPFRGDILVAAGKISAIGTFPAGRAETVIDCNGAAVMPGFIDVASAGDRHGNLLRFPEAADYLEGGVTSAIGGHGGVSLAPFVGGDLRGDEPAADMHPVNTDWGTMQEFLRTLARRQLGMNFGTLVGAASARRAAGGNAEAFRILVSKSIEEGALGISARFEATAKGERAALMALAHAHRVPLVLAAGEDAARAVQEIMRMDDRERPAIILQARGFSREQIGALGEVGVWVEVEASEFSVIPITALLPGWALVGGRAEVLARLADEWMREKIMKELAPPVPEELTVVHAPRHRPLVGLTLRAFMDHHGMDDPKRALVALMRQARLSLAVRARRNERAAMREVLNAPNVLIAARELGSYPPSWREIAPHHGFLALMEDVKREGTMPLGELVKKISAVPAARFGLKGRGMLKEGCIADITVIKDGRAEHVLVGGAAAVKGGAATGGRHGRPLARADERYP